jgi:hypothetical protein
MRPVSELANCSVHQQPGSTGLSAFYTHTHGAKTQANCDRHKLVHLIKLKVGARDIFCSNLTTPFHPCKLGGAETSGVDRIVDKDEVIILGGEEV